MGGLRRRTLLRGAGAIGLTAGVAGCGAEKTATSKQKGDSLPKGVRSIGPAGGSGVLLLHAWWGVTPGVLAWAHQLGDAGAHVLVPDLYDGKVATTKAEAQSMADGLDDATVADLLDACAGRLAKAGTWSALGWSLGAFHACQLMDGQDDPARAVLFYGGAAPAGGATTRRVQLHVVPDDPYFTADEITTTVDGFGTAGIPVQRYDYPHDHHWFAEPGSPAYDATATRLAQQRAFAFLGLD